MSWARGYEDGVEDFTIFYGKTIKSAAIIENQLHITFTDDVLIRVFDGGQSCCEHRWMSTDDDLEYIKNGVLNGIEIKSCESTANKDDEFDVHDIQFVEIHTGKGSIQLVNHNDHNGYYGGFFVKVAEGPLKDLFND
jgi:hypothetical protein